MYKNYLLQINIISFFLSWGLCLKCYWSIKSQTEWGLYKDELSLLNWWNPLQVFSTMFLLLSLTLILLDWNKILYFNETSRPGHFFGVYLVRQCESSVSDLGLTLIFNSEFLVCLLRTVYLISHLVW